MRLNKLIDWSIHLIIDLCIGWNVHLKGRQGKHFEFAIPNSFFNGAATWQNLCQIEHAVKIITNIMRFVHTSTA